MEPMLQLINRMALDQEMDLWREIERTRRDEVDDCAAKPGRAGKPAREAKLSGLPRQSDNPWSFRLRRPTNQESC